MEFKKKITLSLSLLLCAGSITFVNATPNCAEVTAEQSDIQYLEILSSEIKKFIDDVTMIINRLKDEKDTTPFSQLVTSMNMQLETLHKMFVTPLKERLAQHKDQSSTQYKALKAADNLLAILYTQFQKVSKVMKDPANKQTGVKMATALKNQLDAFFGQYATLDKEMAELHRCLAILQLDNLVKEIAVVRAMFQEAKEGNAKPLPKDQQAKIATMLQKKLKK